MANIEEIALGIAHVLIATDKPEPMIVTVRGQDDLETARMIKRVIDECADADRDLWAVCVAKRLLPFFCPREDTGQPIYRNVPLVRASGLGHHVEFYRLDPD